MPIFTAWTDWIIERGERRLPSEFDIALLPVLVDATIDNGSVREDLVISLLAIRSTAITLVFVADLVGRWSNLTFRERSAVLFLLREQRADRIWLQAAAITRNIVPDEVEEVVLGARGIIAGATDPFMATMGDELLTAALSIYLGSPQPLWWLGTHHVSSQPWKALALSIGLKSDHPLFGLVLDDALTLHDGARVERIVNSTRDSDLDVVFDAMLRVAVTHNGNWQRDAWIALLDRAEPLGLLQDWLVRLIASAPAIMSGVGDGHRWLGATRYKDMVLDGLKTDVATSMALVPLLEMQRLVSDLRDTYPDADSDDTDDDPDGFDTTSENVNEFTDVKIFAGMIVDFTIKMSPRLHETYSNVIRTIEICGFDNEERFLRLEEMRLAALDRSREIEDAYPDPPRVALPGWIGP